MRLLVSASLGALAGAIVAVVCLLAVGRHDRRLRLRDEIADAIGVPVLASLPAWRATGADSWARLLDHHEPGVTEARQLGTALHRLDPDLARGPDGGRSGYSVTVLSLSSDRRALALGPQLAVFAASQGIKTVLVVSPQQDAAPTATLRVACAAYRQTARSRGQLDVSLSDLGDSDSSLGAALTVVVAVVDGAAPQITATYRTNATLFAVSPGTATAEQLAQVAAAAAASGGQIDGFLIADPDQADRTSGRIPVLVRPRNQGQPTRITEVPVGSMLSTISQPVRTQR